MLGYICLHLLVLIRVAYVAALIQFATGRDFQRRVGLLVACKTLGQLRTMWQLVTLITMGKDIFVWRFAGAIGMELYMASPAVYPMFTAAAFQEVINAGMTPPAIFRFQRDNFQVAVKGYAFFRVRPRLGRN